MRLLWWRKERRVNRRNQAPAAPSLNLTIDMHLVASLSMAAVFISAAALLWSTLTAPDTLPLKQVAIEGDFEKVSAEAVRKTVTENIDGGFFSVNIEGVTNAVAALPWVARAEVRLMWPDRLHVTVSEQKAIARMGQGGLVNEAGELFYPDESTYPQGLVELRGPISTVAMMAAGYRDMMELSSGTSIEIERVTLTARRAWQVKLGDGVEVMLGRFEMDARLKRFVHFYPRLVLGDAHVSKVDMRYTNGFSVQWAQTPGV